MSARELFFDALDFSAVKAEQQNIEGSAEVGTGRRERRDNNGAIDGSSGQRAAVGPSQLQSPRPQTPPLPAAQAPASAVPAATAAAPFPPPPPITASELRLAASAALRLAVEAIDAIHGLKEVVLEIADDVRELLEATRRAGRVGERRRSRTAARRRSGGGGLGVRTRSQTQRRQRWR